jgi:FMN phosphatase YigB (HAD superfamily)
MEKKKINFIVTDLDDTIWDWLNMWYQSFNPYITRISKELGIDLSILKENFKKLHQKYHTTESSYIYEELECLSEEQKTILEASVDSKSILHEYYSNKKENLILYDGVLETLKYIKEQGSTIVAFTESNSFYTKYRIKHLQLDGIIDCIYAPLDTGVPSSVTPYYPNGYWEPEITEFRYLSKTVHKPDSEILEIILKDFRAKIEESIYIGDKLDRDVYMAQQLNVSSVWAEYGFKIQDDRYDLLKEVTHWTKQDVIREQEFKNNFHLKPKPDYILENSFTELKQYFNFSKFDRKKTNCNG